MELLALGAAVFLLFFLATVVDLRRALEVVEAERERLQVEADAFGAFAAEVAEFDASRPQLADGGKDGGTLVEASGSPGLREIREAYRRTVMSVPHFEAEYGETLPESMAAEFGDDITAAVAAHTHLTPELKETILQRSRGARERRLVLAEHLKEETSAVSAAADTLERIAKSVRRIDDEPLERYHYDDLRAEWYLLEDRIEECEGVLERRQERIHDRRSLADRVDEVSTFEGYVYEPLGVTYPVLSRGTELLDRLRAAQDRVARSLASHE